MRNFKLIQALIAIAFLIGSFEAWSQQITGYRYWFNDDDANAVDVSVTPATQLQLQAALPAAALAPGFHRITIQFLDDDGIYSTPYTTHFVQRSGSIDAIEYWFNDDTGASTLENVTPAADLDLTTDLDASALPVGMHKVTLRMRDAIGEWSVPITRSFTRSGGMVSGYEYWIDDQVQDRVINSITPASLAHLIADLPIMTEDGEHLFTIRFHDQHEGWSVPLTTEFTFITSIEELPGITDVVVFPNPVVEQLGIRMNAAEARSLEIEILDGNGKLVQRLDRWNVVGNDHRSWDISSLSQGNYILRMSDSTGSWSTSFIKY